MRLLALRGLIVSLTTDLLDLTTRILGSAGGSGSGTTISKESNCTAGTSGTRIAGTRIAGTRIAGMRTGGTLGISTGGILGTAGRAGTGGVRIFSQVST